MKHRNEGYQNADWNELHFALWAGFGESDLKKKKTDWDYQTQRKVFRFSEPDKRDLRTLKRDSHWHIKKRFSKHTAWFSLFKTSQSRAKRVYIQRCVIYSPSHNMTRIIGQIFCLPTVDNALEVGLHLHRTCDRSFHHFVYRVSTCFFNSLPAHTKLCEAYEVS